MAERIRRARLDEADALTALTLRSKAYWGYDAEFMSQATPDLTFQANKFGPDFLVFVLQEDGQYQGFVSLIPRDHGAIELYDLFIDPAQIRTGLGTLLWRHAVDTARALHFRRIVLTADPHAIGFYVKQGATVTGTIPSVVDPARLLPRLEFVIP